MIGIKISRSGISNDLKNRFGIKVTSRFSSQRIISHKQRQFFVFSIILLLIFSPRINTQQVELPFEDIVLGEGTPTNVQHILQDRTGYLWFATWNGLYKYDGYSFLSYKRDFDNSNKAYDNTMSVLYEDKDGIIWIGSPFGLDRFDPKSESFTHFTPNPNDTIGNKSNEVLAICEDKFGTLWIGTNYGLYKFDRKNTKFTLLLHDSTDPGSIASNAVSVICRDKQGSLWFGTKAGLDKFDFNTGKFEHCYNDPDEKNEVWYNSFSMYWINDIIEDENSILWLGTNRGLVEFNSKEGSFIRHLYIPNDFINRIASISQDVLTGSLWLSTTRLTSIGELFSFDKKSKKFTQYSSKGNCVISERSGTIWIGTDVGIKKLNRIKQPFKHYPTKDIIYTVKTGKEGIIWIFNLIPIIDWKQFDIKKEKFIQGSFGKDQLLFVYNSGADLLFCSAKGICYLLNNKGKKWIWGTFTREFVNSVNCSWKGNSGYWLGTDTGTLHYATAKTNSFKQMKNLRISIDYIYEDSFGLLWVATSMGKVYCYQQEKDSLIEHTSITINPLALHGRTINEIIEDKKGRILFATTNGLEIYDRYAKSLNHFTNKDGLAGNNVRGILEDKHGYLWIITNKGISKFDPEKEHFKNYDVSYGLKLTADVFYGKGCKTSNGEMFFPSAMGFTRFHPDSVKDNPFIPPIVITSFKKFDKPYPFKTDINLPYDENFISFEFAALSYVSPERNQFAYMMEGLDKDWVYSGTRRYASYPNLNPGEYIFRVKGSNNDGVWNEAGTSILIIISPPWWKTTWAYIIYSILILSIIYMTWKMQLKRIRIGHEYEMSKFEAEKLHEVDEIKSKFFTNISHEFRTPLTLILGPIKKMIEQSKDEENKNELRVVCKNADKLLGLVNQLLDISKLESGNMKLQTNPQNIIPLLKALVLSFASYAERKRITLKYNSSEDEIIAYIDKDKIERIITNVLSNAFKVTPNGGKIEVTIQPTPRPSHGGDNTPLKVPSSGGDLGVGLKSTPIKSFVEITISDTGVGIPKEKLPQIFDRFYQVDGSHTREQEGTGIGLSLTKELVELHKGTIEVESEEGKGTTFTIIIPLGKEHLKPEEIVEREQDEDKDYDKDKDKLIIEVEEDFKRKENEKIDSGMFEKGLLPLLLLVEDNSDVRNYIKNNLNKEFRILEAVDGEDGWEKSIERHPDLIISDVMMPKMDGFQLCEKLKTDERTSHIPVILLTAKAASSDKIEGFETGADDYIMKPFEPDELKARIKNLIEQRKRIHEHFKKHGLFEIDEKNVTPVDQKFLHKAFEIINKNMSDTTFDLESFAESINLSRSVLHRKVTSLTGESPGELIRRIRLKRAAQLIEQKFGNISEISLEVGFSNPSQFARSFQRQFGVAPSTYQKKFTNNTH